MRANLPDCVEYRTTAGLVQHIRILIHQLSLARCTPWIGRQGAMSGDVVVPIHGTGFVAMQMRTIAGERDQVRHRRLFYIAPSWSRLVSERSRPGRARLRPGASVQHYKHTLGFLILC
jgi:hypothetical protein